ncbi:MAG: hypothetical protein OEZ47_02780 [Gammaproteobacteria bacterium]|nr:hypothetical protein [Gammaproteobacteria bacterium]
MCVRTYFLGFVSALMISFAALASQDQKPLTESIKILKILQLDLIEKNLPGATLYTTYCSTCHELPHPSLHTVKDWEKVLTRMRDNALSLGKPAPSNSELEEMLHFLRQYNSGH